MTKNIYRMLFIFEAEHHNPLNIYTRLTHSELRL